MKRQHYKLLVLALTTLFTVSSYAHDAEINGIFYNLNEDDLTATVTQNGSADLYAGSYTGSVNIPNSITHDGKTYTVTGIGRMAFFSCARLTSVTIPSTVTSIEEFAFQNCEALTNINIPASVTSIDRYALSLCKGLTTLIIPESVTSIGEAAFWGCVNITSFSIPQSVTVIEKDLFYNCCSLTSVTIQEGVTSIKEGAFSGCSNLTSITIPASVTSIESNVFSFCSSLSTVYSLNSIPPTLYFGCFDNNILQKATLYVLKDAIEAYRNAEGWKDFVNIEGFTPTGIYNMKTDEIIKKDTYYDLNGSRLNAPKKGLNIINGKKMTIN